MYSVGMPGIEDILSLGRVPRLKEVTGLLNSLSAKTGALDIWGDVTLQRYAVILYKEGLMVATTNAAQQWDSSVSPALDQRQKDMNWRSLHEKHMYKSCGWPKKKRTGYGVHGSLNGLCLEQIEAFDQNV
ncbi:hypothetical protein NDU88_001248 [Pleurodeles waltl]|uniref:Uncharacterized protein n=1 Tax=Pleurodeles waltl TaxID=8319 RepID=A0AAV7WN13_PLEWA|nr:hypothetical protein NDU88_001248 [Pleurodeles waltl]